MEVEGGNYYTVTNIKTHQAWEILKSIFDGEVDFMANWLFLSTSGVHGSYMKLIDTEIIKREMEEEGDYGDPKITFLVLKPRVCQLLYGELPVRNDEDKDWLNKVVYETLEGINRSQIGNLAQDR